MVRMLIAEDNLTVAKQLFNDIIEKNNNIQLVGINSDGLEVMEYLKKEIPDILLLDIVMPKMNGMEVLDKIIKEKEKYFPKLHIIIISGHTEKLYEKNNRMKYIYAKIEKTYDVKKIEYIMENLCDSIAYDNIIKYVNDVLSYFEFNVKSLAYIFFKDAICEVLYRKNQKFDLENDIYINIAKKYNKKNAKIIKWSIEKLINQMYINTRYDVIKKYFGFYEDKKPSTKLFIRKILDNYIELSRT